LTKSVPLLVLFYHWYTEGLEVLSVSLKFSLIESQIPDPDPLSFNDTNKDQGNIKGSKRVIFVKMVLIATLVFAPYFANAGIFSLFGVFGVALPYENSPEVSNVESNSQNITLLQATVNFDPNSSKGGGDITIVDETALLAETGITGSLVEVTGRDNTGQISVYEVREGDTLSQIAEMFEVSVNTIRWANDFEGSISPGQTLIILPVTGVKHTVKTGGTVMNLANIYGDNVGTEEYAREIALFNGISMDYKLQPGEEIIVPHAEISVPSPQKSTSVVRVSSSGSSVPNYSGYYTHPVPAGTKTQGIHGYNAIDIGAAYGTPIYASAGGQVIRSKITGWNGGYGIYIVVKHDNGTQTVYAHNSENLVGTGAWVTKGQQIGRVGSTGNSTGNHTHFEIRGARMPF
jgi:murein DD-endopeptidase MepM/ murein hydrolase activator NlpD